MCTEVVRIEPFSLAYVSDHLKTQEKCNEAVRNKLCMILFVPDHLKTVEMCNEIMRKEMCKKAAEADSSNLGNVLDHFITYEMRNKACEEDPSSLIYVPAWFVRLHWVNMWYDDHYDDDNYGVIMVINGYQKRKAHKAQIKKELVRIAWHPSRWWDWCMSENEKKEAEKLWK